MFAKFLATMKNSLAANQVIEDELLRYAYSTDASLYRMVPQLVLLVKLEAEVVTIIQAAAACEVKLTFRAAGTSLSGQAVTNQVLVMLANDSWLSHQIFAGGNEIKLEPGIIGADANGFLQAYNKQIGPDPGSLSAAKIGGIIANNSSGMCCGTAKNSYATLKNMRAVLSDGSVFDSSNDLLLAEFKLKNSNLLAGISAIRQKIILDEELTAFIRKKFAIKNTSGYSLNAFLDFADPLKILERLMIGSEGTLGFISNVTLYSVPKYAHKALNFIYGTLTDLINLTVKIADLEISSVELLDYYSLQSVADDKELHDYLLPLPNEEYAAIMVELSAESQAELSAKVAAVATLIDSSNLFHQLGFTSDQRTMALLWKARAGILPTIAAQRPLGSGILIEDIAVEIELLPNLIQAMRDLFNKFNYKDAAIFGHVLAGNIHFVVTPNFNNPHELAAYDRFMHEFTDLVAKKFNGSLKAEHGSGRNISPFALVEWGEKCWDLMWEIKYLFDPKGIFNPEVKLTRDYTLHMQHLKSFAAVDPAIDKCMECGFCDPVCPSRKLSLTPRQRNAVARQISTLAGPEKAVWQEKYQYYGVSTCATTGMCQTVCPVGINTGAFILAQKPKLNLSVNHERQIKIAKAKVQAGNLAATIVGANTLQRITSYAHGKFKTIPIYLATMPKAQKYTFAQQAAGEVLLVPACPNRIFAAENEYGDYPSKLILEKMGFKVDYMTGVQTACCGQIYHSQANNLQQQQMIIDMQSRVTSAKLAIVDNSSCAGFAKEAGVDLLDINQFIVENLDRSKLSQKYRKIALHIDCSSAKHAFNPGYLALLQRCSEEVIVPVGIKCCGFAGDKGFTLPELNASSLSGLASQVNDCEIGVTFNRSCQIGLTQHAKIQYLSLVEVVLNCLAT